MTEAEDALERELSEPTDELVAALTRLEGDIVVLGAGGKMGPSLIRLALAAVGAAGRPRRVVAVSRFTEPGLADRLRSLGASVVSADLLDPTAVAGLPDAPNVVYMVGQKFGTVGDASRTWAVNCFAAGLAAARYRQARIVAFSTGNVYPLWPITSEGPTESDPTGPIGEYAQSALARERILEFFAAHHGTPLAILRLNYAIEPRYGVLRDIAERVRAGSPIDLTMGRVNLIWQRDANAVALRALEQCSVPPLVLNVTGRPAISVRAIAESFGSRWKVSPTFTGTEAATALLSNSSAAYRRFGSPPTSLDRMIEGVATWVEAGGRSLGKPTHFEERSGRF